MDTFSVVYPDKMALKTAIEITLPGFETISGQLKFQLSVSLDLLAIHNTSTIVTYTNCSPDQYNVISPFWFRVCKSYNAARFI